MASRINVSLDEEDAAKLSRLADRMPATLAKSLLSHALDGADPDADDIVALLDAIPGAYSRTEEGIAQARRGEGVPLDQLA
jgi:hypothetical protein